MGIKFIDDELVIGGGDWELAPFKFSKILKIGGGGDTPSWVDIVVTGTGSVTLANAKADGLNYVKLFGACEQKNVPNGYKELVGISMNNNCLYQITDFKLRGSDTIRISFSIDGACNVFGCYQGVDANDNYDIYASTTSGSKYLRYGNGTYLSYWSSDNLGKRFDVVLTPTGTTGMPQDSTWTEMTFESANDMLVGSTTLTGTSAKLKGRVYGHVIVDGRLELIPVERESDNEICYYDKVSGTVYEPTGTTPTSLGYATPTPTTPVDIVCNNGTIKYGYLNKNLSYGNLDNVGYTSTGGTSTSSTFCGNLWKIKCAKGEKYTVSCGNFPDGISGVFVNTWNADGTFNMRQAISMSTSYTYTIPSGIGWVNFTLYKTGGITIGSNSWLQVEKGTTPTSYVKSEMGIYTDGTTETISVKDNSNTVIGTATAENLLGFGSYKDIQDVISGNVTRNFGIKVFNGSETFNFNNTFNTGLNDRIKTKEQIICTHFPYSSASASLAPDLTCVTYSSQNIGFKMTSLNGDTTSFKAWLKEQYENETPVIIVYRLLESTEETVTPQALTTKSGTNIIEIIQASINNLPLEVSYKGIQEQQGE